MENAVGTKNGCDIHRGDGNGAKDGDNNDRENGTSKCHQY